MLLLNILLFHFVHNSDLHIGAFTLATLAISLITYFFIACWTYGASIPSGLFVPCLTIGALYGRFIVTALV